MVRDDDHDPVPRGPLDLAGILERSPGDFTIEEVVSLAAKRQVRLLSLLHVGGDGQPKTLDFVIRDPAHLEAVLSGGERADGSSLFPGTGLSAGRSDIVLVPRLHRVFLDPFSPWPTLVVLCGHQDRNGEPLSVSPDTVVRRAWQRLVDEFGVELHALGEVEFFLGRPAAEGEEGGRSERGYHATAPFVYGQDLRRRAMDLLCRIGVGVKYGHAEVGYIEAEKKSGVAWEQHEIELALAPLPEAAENIVLTQWVLANLARSFGLRISFAPVVRVGHAGSGLHVHLAPMVDGVHRAGRDPAGELYRESRWLIGGLVALGGALMAFGNRVKSSFIRLSQRGEIPHSLSWGEQDRKALVRLPLLAGGRENRPVGPPTVEFRLPDGSAHPHLLMAGIAQALAHGAQRPDLAELLDRSRADRAREDPGSALPVPRTPTQVEDALRGAREAFTAGGVFPEALLDADPMER